MRVQRIAWLLFVLGNEQILRIYIKIETKEEVLKNDSNLQTKKHF